MTNPVRRDSIRPAGAFTLLELLVVFSIIVVLAAIVVGTSGYVQKKGARSRAEAEIAAMSAALDSYKADNGIYPQHPASAGSGHALYQALSGDGDDVIGGSRASTGTPGSTGKGYMTLKNNMMNPTTGGNIAVVDPWKNEYQFKSPGVYNPPTFDLWTTGSDPNSTNQAVWIKNW